MTIQPHSKIVFIGDSITDCDRARPHGEAEGGGLGNGYVQYVNALLGSVYPQRAIRVVNNGTSGNTVLDLKARWDKDVLSLQPDWLSVMIGINDVWRQFDASEKPETHVLPQEYETTLRELIESAKSSTRLHGLVVMTPFFIETNRDDAMRQRMDEYGVIAKKIAHESDAIFVNTQAAFDRVLEHTAPSSLAGDRVHPSSVGHMILARAWLQAVGFEWK